jgi:hypothetical protein
VSAYRIQNSVNSSIIGVRCLAEGFRCVMDQLTHNNRIKILKFAEPIYNARELWVSPDQSTKRVKFGLRA